MMDNQNIDDGNGIAAHSSHTQLSVGGSGLATFSLVSVIRACAIFSLYCLWPPPQGPKDSICILESRKRKKRERERNAKGIHNISAYIPLARTKLHGHTQLQGTLGNVVLILIAMYLARNPLTKKWRSGMWRGSLCHSLYAAFLNRITVTVDADYRLWRWLWTEIWLHQLLFSSLVYQLGIIIEQTYFIGPVWGLNELMYIKGLSMVPGSKLSARVISLLFLNTSITWVKFYVIACIILSFPIAA